MTIYISVQPDCRGWEGLKCDDAANTTGRFANPALPWLLAMQGATPAVLRFAASPITLSSFAIASRIFCRFPLDGGSTPAYTVYGREK